MSEMISDLLDDTKRAESSFMFSHAIVVDKKGDLVLTCDYVPIEKIFLSFNTNTGLLTKKPDCEF